jgi:hypothetical protein
MSIYTALYNFQSVYITVYRHKQLFYIAFIKCFEAMKCASVHRKSLSSDIDRVQNSSRLPAIAGSFSTFAGDFVIEKKGNKKRF